MSLEDSEKLPQDRFEMGDNLCVLPPGKVNMVVEGYYEMNHGEDNMYYYVQREAPNPLTKPPTPEKIMVHWIPLSRKDELVPSGG